MNKETIRAIILVNSKSYIRDFKTACYPTAIWPLGESTVLQHLIDELVSQGIHKISVCTNSDDKLLQEVVTVPLGIDISFHHETLPRGSAGSIKAAVNDEDQTLIVFHSAMVTLPSVDTICEKHKESGQDLTVFFNPGEDGIDSFGKPSGVYVCSDKAVSLIPQSGYYDIKEGLIPDMVRRGMVAGAVVLPMPVGNFLNVQGFLSANQHFLTRLSNNSNGHIKKLSKNKTANILSNGKVKIAESARIFGDVFIQDGTSIGENSIIIGPVSIGKNCKIAKGAVLRKSVLAKNISVLDSAQINESLIADDMIIANGQIVREEILFQKDSSSCVKKSCLRLKSRLFGGESLTMGIGGKMIKDCFGNRKFLMGLLALVLAFFWSFWPNIISMWNIWMRSDEYSAGLLVPFLAVYILYGRRDELQNLYVKPDLLLGIILFLFSQLVRFAGLFYMYGSIERLSIVIGISSIVLILFGTTIFYRTLSVQAFLLLMLPWPNQVQSRITFPLQDIATNSSVFLLEAMGYSILQEGHVIHIGETTVAVAEACNGLRMITAFLVIIALLVLVIKKPLWQKVLLMVSALPISLLCNTLRLAVTSVAFTMLDAREWQDIFHDFGGYAMMPVALGLAMLEIWFLGALTSPPQEEQIKEIIVRQS